MSIITSDIQELNIADLNDFEGDPSTMLTENPEGLWKKINFDPNKQTSDTTHVLAFHDNEIVSTPNAATAFPETIEVNASTETFNMNSAEGSAFEYNINNSNTNSFVQRVSKNGQTIDTFYDFSSGTPTWGLQTSDSAEFTWGPDLQQVATGTDVSISIDSNGNGFAFFENNNSNVRVRRYDAALQRWESSATTLANNGTDPDIALSESGIALAVWSFNTGISQIVQSAYFDPATQSWSTPVDLDLPTSQIDYEPKVSINDNGDGVVVWNSQSQSFGDIDVKTAHFNGASKNWTIATIISLNTENSFDAKVGIDSNGDAVAVWNQSDAIGRFYIESANYDAATTTWSTPVILSPEQTNARFPELSVNSSGNATAIWIDDQGSSTFPHVLRSNHYNKTTKTWSSRSTDISGLKVNSYPAKVSMSDDGSALAIWTQYDAGMGVRAVESSTYDPNTQNWSIVNILSEQVGAIGDTYASVGMDQQGNGVAVWVNAGQDNFVEASTYQKVIKKWSHPDQISTIENTFFLTTVATKSNRSAAVWGFDDGTTRLTGAGGGINPNIITANDSTVSFAFRSIKEVGEPVDISDAATKNYVDNAVAAANQAFFKMLQDQGLLKEESLETLKKNFKPVKKKSNKTKKTKTKGE